MTLRLLVILNFLSLIESARILGIFPNIGYSQYILGSSLMKELATRGHAVTVISPHIQKTHIANYKEILVKDERNISNSGTLYQLESSTVFDNIISLYDKDGLSTTEHVLKDIQVQELLHSDATFDLVICEVFANEALMGFAHHFQAPLILFSSVGAIEWSNHLVANPAPFSHIPISFNGYTDRMTFWERVQNSAVGLFDIIYKHLVIFPKQNNILKKYFPNAPNLNELMYNASLILLNSNVATNAPMAHVPNMIEIGGFHVSPKKLSKELQEFLDSAHDGAVFFSMGSNLKSSDLSKEKTNGILQVFSKLKQKVLWKWEDEDLPGKPNNVKIGKWLPQQDILAHPNIRAFITHGGLLSVTEAVYNGVPLIVIPVFGDQKMNAETAVSNGFAVKLSFQELTEETLSRALQKILTNFSYRESAQRRSKILRDQPMKPIETAMFWIEYVLRHHGALHLRSAALDLYWFQYFLLDVITFAIVVSTALLVAVKVSLHNIFKCKRSRNISKKKKE